MDSKCWLETFIPHAQIVYGYLCRFIAFYIFLDFELIGLAFVSLLTFDKWLMIALSIIPELEWCYAVLVEICNNNTYKICRLKLNGLISVDHQCSISKWKLV